MTRKETSSSGNATSAVNVPTKLCCIVRRQNFEGYGFNLHSEKNKPGQYIGKVDANSPAEMAGLIEGARIIEVNGVNISTETHKQVVQRIRSLSNEVRLLIEDSDTNTTSISNIRNVIEQKYACVNAPKIDMTKITISTGMRIGVNKSNQISRMELELPTTVAEMRAKLSSKKKYDPKNDVVDLKKKFEIIQKL